MPFSKQFIFIIVLACCKIVQMCLLNLCELPGNDFCEGRQCRMTPDCRNTECYCDETSTHSSCANNVSDCPCVHGQCNTLDNNQTACVCELGYQGENCSETVCPFGFNPCDFAATCPGKDCRTLPNCSFECYCGESSTMCATTPPPSTLEPPGYSPCGRNFIFRNVSERTCETGIICQYGQCVSDNNTEVCSCDDGATGVQCETKCCLDCGVHGDCRIHEQLGEYCQCFESYTGDSCDTLSPEYNPCYDNFTGRTSLERFCNGIGFFCEYGQCVKTNTTWACHCDNSDGYLCERKCCLDCGPNGECRWNSKDKVEYCNCFHNYTGERCEIIFKPVYGPAEEVRWYWWVVGVCAVVLVVLIVIILLVPYLMWKHRVILVMKLVYFFKVYEDEDDRIWDAFVSYRSVERDEGFIVNTLLPKLEDEFGFKLCLHFRDFVGGATISDNIIRAVKESRRTILLISPEYVESEWTKLEYEVAQQEMLKRKHRIIPILLEDITNCRSSMDTTLKNILSSVTYLEWPDDNCSAKKMEKFWKRLQLSLPKKRTLNSESNKICPPDNAVKAEDTKFSFDSFRSSHVNKGFDSDSNADYDTIPADDDDTINENHLDELTNIKNETKTCTAHNPKEETLIKILDEIPSYTGQWAHL